MLEREPVVITWEEWKASRAGKRALLRDLGLDVPSRRTKGVGKGDVRLRAAFGGSRVPAGLCAR